MICTPHLEDVSVDRSIILKWILKTMSQRVWTGFFWLRIDTYGGGRQCIYNYHTTQEIS